MLKIYSSQVLKNLIIMYLKEELIFSSRILYQRKIKLTLRQLSVVSKPNFCLNLIFVTKILHLLKFRIYSIKFNVCGELIIYFRIYKFMIYLK